MAQIETYTAGKLASARTSVLPADTSGQEIGMAVAQTALTIQAVQAERKKAIDALAIETANTDMQTQYLGKEHAIKMDPTTNSSNVEERLKEAALGIKSNIIGGIADGSTRQAVELGIQSDLNVAMVRAAKTKYEMQDAETVNRIFSNSTKLIDVVSKNGDADQIQWAFKKLDDTQSTLLPFMNRDVANTQKYIQNSKDSLVKQFVAQGITAGREDELDAANVLGKFKGASSATQEQVAKDIKTALETKKYRADVTTAYQVQNDNLKTYQDLRDGVKSFADIEHQLSEQSYLLTTGKYSPQQEKDIRGKITFLDSMRRAQLSGAYVKSRDNLEAVTGLQTELANLVQTSEGSKELSEGVYLDQIKAFQEKVTKAFVDDGTISAATYNKMYSETAGVLLKDLTEKTFENTGWLTPDNSMAGLNSSMKSMAPFVAKDDRAPLLAIFREAKRTDGSVDSKTMNEAYGLYLDDKKAGMAPPTMTPEIAQSYALKAKLANKGYPGAYKVGDPIQVQGRTYTIGGFKNGEVLIQTDENTARNVVTYAKPYKMTRN